MLCLVCVAQRSHLLPLFRAEAIIFRPHNCNHCLHMCASVCVCAPLYSFLPQWLNDRLNLNIAFAADDDALVVELGVAPSLPLAFIIID